MIQTELMKQLEKVIPFLKWSVDYHTQDDNTGTVYTDSGSKPDIYDTEYRYPSYQVYIRSSDWDLSKLAAYEVYGHLHKKANFEAKTKYEKDDDVIKVKTYHVFFIEAASEPLRIGENNGLMEYSVNFDVTLKEVK